MNRALLHALCAHGAQPWPSDQRVAIVVAHPDDEVIGMGSRLAHLREQATIVYVTDGSPANLHDAFANGCASRQEYALTRQREMQAVMETAGLAMSQVRLLEYGDQEASLHLAELSRALAALFDELQPRAVVTHPYEGGHPDHDATAFAVHAACSLLEARAAGQTRVSGRLGAPALLEMTSYFNRGGRITPFEFLPCPQRPHVTLRLSEEQRALKRRMLACYATQRETLSYFPVETERFRAAPRYDFAQPPHEGVLFYEMFEWGMTGERWRELAVKALEELGVTAPL